MEELKKAFEYFHVGDYFGQLEMGYRKIIDEIYVKKNNMCLNGRGARDFYEKINLWKLANSKV